MYCNTIDYFISKAGLLTVKVKPSKPLCSAHSLLGIDVHEDNRLGLGCVMQDASRPDSALALVIHFAG